LTVRCFWRPVLCAARSSCGRTGCPGRVGPAAVRCPATGASTAAWGEPLRPFCRSLDGHVRWSVCRWTSTGPPAALRTAGVRHTRAASPVGCPTHVPHTSHLQWLRWGARASAVVSSSRASGPVGGHTDEDGSSWAACERSVSARRGHLAAGVGRRRNLQRTPRTVSAAAVRGCCPGFRTPRTARRIPPWPVSGCDRYRNRSPGRRPLVGWSQRW
jgi:hypothetical protein